MRLAKNRKAETSAIWRNGQKGEIFMRVNFVVGPPRSIVLAKNGLGSNVVASKFQTFSGGHAPYPLAVACLRTHH